MPLTKKLIGKAVGAVLQIPVVAALAGEDVAKVGSVLEKHFTFSASEISVAFQESYEEALAGISAGLGANSKLAWFKKLAQSKLSSEFSNQIESHYFKSFAAQHSIPNLRQNLLSNFDVLSKPVFQDDNKNHFSESELAALVGSHHTDAITYIILEQVGSLDDTLADFLAHDELLGNAVLFFFREKIREDKRVEASLAALQREGLWADVSDIKLAQEQLSSTLKQRFDQQDALLKEAMNSGDYAKVGTIAPQLDVLKNSLEQVPELLQRAQTAWQKSQQELLNISKRLEEKIDHIDENVETLLEKVDRIENMLFDKFRKILQQFDLSNQLKAGDAFTRHNSQSRELIQVAMTELKALPNNNPQNNELFIMAATVLSSTGKTIEAEKLFIQARDSSQNDNEKALASFNLFQIHLWNEKYEQALDDLQVAIDIDASRFALHDVDRYPIIKLLGAGGMGCVFLCEDSKWQEKVVVKCFWEEREGSLKEVFSEAMNMRQIAGEYVPKPLDYEYADSANNKHPYFVTEYIDEALDGEDWLKQHGKLDVATGINVGLQIAKGLQVAHSKKIYHLDLKPANLLFKQTDTGLMVKIIDFGLSGVASSLREEVSASNSGGKTVLEQSIVAGTHDYGAPEQLGDNKYGTISAKTDLFAFGATLYRLITEQSPRHLNPKRLADAPLELFYLLCDCKEENPNDRPEISEVIERLEGLLVVEEEKEELVVEEEKPQLKPGDIFRDPLKDNSEGPEMVLIPAGTFRMGDITGNGWDSEQPVHEVSVESFAMGRYPVTFAEYDYFCEATNRGKPEDEDWGRDNRPVINVSWHDAVAYTEWLSKQTGQEYRLPTEAEWEYAARAGTETDYWWGNDIDETKANYNSNIGHTTPVGDYEANRFGLYDTAGNVWEWCADNWHDNYKGAPTDGRVWEVGSRSIFGFIRGNSQGDESYRVLRGGSWHSFSRDLRTANRSFNNPGNRDSDYGFRVVRAAWT